MQVRLLPTFLAAFVGFLIENTRHLGAPSASTRGPAVWLASTWVRGPVSLALSPTLCLSPGAAEALHRRGPRRATRSQALRFQSVSWRVFRRGAGALAGRVAAVQRAARPVGIPAAGRRGRGARAAPLGADVRGRFRRTRSCRWATHDRFLPRRFWHFRWLGAGPQLLVL